MLCQRIQHSSLSYVNSLYSYKTFSRYIQINLEIMGIAVIEFADPPSNNVQIKPPTAPSCLYI